MKKNLAADRQLLAECLAQKAGGADPEAYLRSIGMEEQQIPALLAGMLEIDRSRKAARSRMKEGGAVAAIGLGGWIYTMMTEKDSLVWILWSAAGAGIWANGWWKRKKIKRTVNY